MGSTRARLGAWRLLFLWGLELGAWSLFLTLIYNIPALAAETASAETKPPASEETHWSLKPVTRPIVPAVQVGKWKARNPIDNFILARLAQAKLSPSPEAPRRTLIRRLYFDLIGLPPTPAEVRVFERDMATNAYEKVVERLLASPHYGERWGQHWLDVVRFAETHGFEMNQPRSTAWRYRDYVIDAFNQDKPYDRFILDQFAGDIFGEDAAMGFLVGGAWDQVKSPDPVLTAAQRADELHDMVSTTGSAFLGLTIGCARCHNHKFDPVPQTDYYAVKACLAGVQHGERALPMPDRAAREVQAERARKELAEVEARLAQFEPIAFIEENLSNDDKPADPATGAEKHSPRAAVNARRNTDRFPPVSAKRLRFTIARTTDAEPCLDELEVYTAEKSPRNIALASAGTRATASSVFPNSDLHRLEHINDGKFGNSHSWISNERGKGWVELEFPEPVTIERVVWGRDREQQFSDRLALRYRVEVALETNDWRLVASSADRAPYVAGRASSNEPTSQGLSETDSGELKHLLEQQTKLEARLKELTTAPMVYAGKLAAVPEPTHRLQRGDPMQPREVVEPGALGALKVSFRIEAAGASPSPSETPLTEDQSRRLALARWLAHPSNPLPARVIANRLWQHHFGEGIVSTPSDFGKKGAPPSHPALLDWLAAELVEPGNVEPFNRSIVQSAHNSTIQRFNDSTMQPWSLKHIHHLIVTSATYRQASASRPDGLAIDGGSRLLWRFPPQRLEAEPLRDAILAVSGKLDLRPGGPGFSAFESNDNYVRVYNPKKEFGPEDWRRMVYMTKVRMQQDATFGAFDCPDGGQIAPKRLRSTTPLQALNLLNSEFILRQAEFFAARLEHEAGKNVNRQIRLAFDLSYNRRPSADETSRARALIARHGLAVFCRALFNSNEFLFLE